MTITGRRTEPLYAVFVALSAALAAFGLMNAGAVAGGARFGRIAWPPPRVLAREGVDVMADISNFAAAQTSRSRRLQIDRDHADHHRHA